MEVRRMRYLCVEIYKTLNDLNPGHMKDIFQVQQSAFGTRRIRYEGATSGITYQTHLNRLRPLKFLKEFD